MAITKNSNSEVIYFQKTGESLITDPPIFSHDAVYLYVNCKSKISVFNCQTGTFIRNLEIKISNDVLQFVSLRIFKNTLIAVTENSYLFQWDDKFRLTFTHELEPHGSICDLHLITEFNNALFICCYTTNKKTYRFKVYRHMKNSFTEVSDHHLHKETIKSSYNKKLFTIGGSAGNEIFGYVTQSEKDNTNRLFVKSIDGTKLLNKYPERSNWVVIKCHPTEQGVIVAGDSSGKVSVIRGLFFSKPVVTVYNWHSLSCEDIALSTEGTTMYTGGSECVLVRWNLESTTKDFLPRLSAEISHLIVSADNELIAVSTKDNGIIIIESQFQIRCSIEQFSWGISSSSCGKTFPVGLVFDPRSRSIVTNAKTGHIQFYSPQQNTILNKIDVTEQNYITQEKDKIIINTDVTHCAITSDGVWLATVETRIDPPLSMELRLKIWQYNINNQRYELNTCINQPHNNRIYSIEFRLECNKLQTSTDDVSSDYLLVTSGCDNYFRIWIPQPIDSIYKKGFMWICRNLCDYKNLSCGPITCSEDGSVLAVAFEEILTFWDLDLMKIRTSLPHSHVITLLQFGRKNCSHYIVSCTKVIVLIWNILNLNLEWAVNIVPNILISDPLSQYMALFSDNNKMFVFSPNSNNLVYKSKILCDVEILSAIFVPREISKPSEQVWLQESNIYYINSKQQLMCVGMESYNSSSQINVNNLQNFTEVPNLYVAVVKTKQDKKEIIHINSEFKGLQFGNLGSKAVRQLLENPCHTMPPISLICGSFIQSLILKKKTDEKRQDKKTKVNNIENSQLSSDYSDEEMKIDEKIDSVTESKPELNDEIRNRRHQLMDELALEMDVPLLNNKKTNAVAEELFSLDY